MSTRAGGATKWLALSVIALACLAGGVLLRLQGGISPAESDQGWTSQEKTAYLDMARHCPETQCRAAWWHPGIRGVILEISDEFQSSQLALQPESLVYLRPQIVHDGDLPQSVTQTLLRLPEQADEVPVIAEGTALPSAEQETLMQQLSQCVTNAQGIGVRDRFITISLDGLMEALGQGRAPETFFAEKERQCVSDLLKQGYYVSYEEYENIPAL